MIVEIDEVAHALGEVEALVGAPVGDFHPTPGPVDIEEDEQIDRAIAAIFAVVAPKLAGLGRDRRAHLADELGWTFVEGHDRSVRIGRLGIEIEDILHARDIFAIDLGDTSHVLAPGLEPILPQPLADGFSRPAGALGSLVVEFLLKAAEGSQESRSPVGR